MLTMVVNLSTGEERHYLNIPPEKAVIFAHLSSVGKTNTFEWSELYQKYRKKLIHGRWSVAIGDWCALVDKSIDKSINKLKGKQ